MVFTYLLIWGAQQGVSVDLASDLARDAAFRILSQELTLRKIILEWWQSNSADSS